MRVATLAVVAFALASCTTAGGLKMSAGPTEVPPEKALAFPAPGGPGIVSVIERNFSNAVQQDIVLETRAVNRGQNYIQVRYFGPASRPFEGSSRLPTRMMTMGDAVGEMRSEFPSIRMSISANFNQNNYGAFSYAYGTSASSSDACIFGWQQIRAPDSYVRTFRYLGTIQTRVRVCETGATRDQLLAQMYHYTLTGSFDSIGWNPYAVVGGPDPVVGQLGRPIYAGSGPTATIPPISVVPVAAPRSVTRPAIRRTVRPAAITAPVRPIVPAVAIPAPDMSSLGAPFAAPVSVAGATGNSRLGGTLLRGTSTLQPSPQTMTDLMPVRTSRYGSPLSAPAASAQAVAAPAIPSSNRTTSMVTGIPTITTTAAAPNVTAAQPAIPAVPCASAAGSACGGGL